MGFLPRTPAWSSLHPATPTFSPVTDARHGRLCDAVGEPGALWKMGTDAMEIAGFYRLDVLDPLFLKVVPTDHLERQERANDIARHVASRGVPTNEALDGFPVSLDDDHALFAFPFEEVRFADAGAADLFAVGAGLARLHRALADAPFADEVTERSQTRDVYLEELRQRVIEGHGLPLDILRIVYRTSTRLPAGPKPQVIHGDLNAANVLFPVHGGPPMFVDLEDAAHSWHPPLVDVAMALERFVLVNADSGAEAVQKGQHLLAGYASVAPAGFPSDAYAPVLAALSVRALVLLSALEAAGRFVAPAEWDKFTFLADLAERSTSTLAGLVAP